MRILDLFSGTGSVVKVFRKAGWGAITVDINPRFKPNVVADISNCQASALGHFDFIWASPPCNCFSVASIGKHWNKDYTPKTEQAKQAIAIMDATVSLIENLKPRYWIIENPRGMLRQTPLMRQLPRVTVTYCQYGERHMKPTDLWGCFPVGWRGKSCKNGAGCHESAPRGAKTGTQGLQLFERYRVPRLLIESFIKAIP